MSGGNGKDTSEIQLIKVTLKGGSMNIDFETKVNVALLSHAARLINLHLDNMIIGNANKPKEETIVKPSAVVPDGILKKMMR